jgi:dipeptide/tripeptide permease
MVICFQIPVSYLTRKIPSFAAMTLGTLVSSVSWLILGANASTAAVVASLVVLAAGEMIQSPRYYEYVSRLAPSGQQGVFMGFAFLPIAIGFVIAGSMGGRLLEYFAGAGAPHRTWWVIAGYGLATTLLMWIYDRVFKPGKGGKG